MLDKGHAYLALDLELGQGINKDFTMPCVGKM